MNSLNHIRNFLRIDDRLATSGMPQPDFEIVPRVKPALNNNQRHATIFAMSTAEKIFQKAQALPEPAQDKLLHIAEEMARLYPSAPQTR